MRFFVCLFAVCCFCFLFVCLFFVLFSLFVCLFVCLFLFRDGSESTAQGDVMKVMGGPENFLMVSGGGPEKNVSLRGGLFYNQTNDLPTTFYVGSMYLHII